MKLKTRVIKSMPADSRYANDNQPKTAIAAQTITDVKTGMKEITVTATWRGYDNRPHTARLITRYSRSGLNDYFYTTH